MRSSGAPTPRHGRGGRRRGRRPGRRAALEGAPEEGKAAFAVIGEGPGLGRLAELLHEREHEL